VHLRNRRRRERLGVESGEQLADRLAERALERLNRELARERRHLVLQLRELRGELGRQNVGTHRERLAELHEDRAELLERDAQPRAQRQRAAPAGQQPAHPRHRPQQVRPPHDLVEPVAHEHALDREHPQQQTQAMRSARHVRPWLARSSRVSRAAARSTSSRNRSTSA
jgi:hypothetical protein